MGVEGSEGGGGGMGVEGSEGGGGGMGVEGGEVDFFRRRVLFVFGEFFPLSRAIFAFLIDLNIFLICVRLKSRFCGGIIIYLHEYIFLDRAIDLNFF